MKRGLLIGYNILSYDKHVLATEFELANVPPPSGVPILDVMVWARHMVPVESVENHKLENVARQLGVVVDGQAHRAGADCEMTWGILERIADMLPPDLDEMLKVQDFLEGFGSFVQYLEKGPIVNCKTARQKFEYRGRPLQEVYQADPGFVEWFLRLMPSENVEALTPYLRGKL